MFLLYVVSLFTHNSENGDVPSVCLKSSGVSIIYHALELKNHSVLNILYIMDTFFVRNCNNIVQMTVDKVK